MLNPNRVVTYAIIEKHYDKTLLTDELIDPDKQVRLELWAYDPKQFSEGNSADDISIVLSFVDTDDDIARYSVMHGNEQLFASKYKLYLPTKEELKAEIETQKAMFYLQQQDNEEKEIE